MELLFSRCSARAAGTVEGFFGGGNLVGQTGTTRMDGSRSRARYPGVLTLATLFAMTDWRSLSQRIRAVSALKMESLLKSIVLCRLSFRPSFRVTQNVLFGT